MFTGYCISSPVYVLTKLLGLQPQLPFFSTLCYKLVFGPFEKQYGGWECSSVVERLSSMNKALGSIPSIVGCVGEV